MRIILLVVFYIVAYVARISDGRGTARTMLGNSVKHIFKQNSKITRGGISEPIDDEIIQKLNRHSRQSSLVNRIDGFLQNEKNLGNNLARVERNLRREKRRAKKLSKIARRRNDFRKDNDADKENAARLQRHPIWQVPEQSTIAIVNLNHTPIAQTEVINRSSLMSTKPPSQSENLDSDRSVNETILSKYPDLQKLSDKNLVFYKIADPKFGIESDARPVFKKLNDEILLPVYPLPSIGISSHFNKSQGFQWRYSGYKKDISSPNKENSSDHYPTSPNRRFLLVPISKDLYVLKTVQDNPQIDTDRIIISNKLAGKNEDNATSALLSFKVHLHHDVKDVGQVYRRKYFNNYRLTDHTANYLHPDHRVFEENASSAENSMPPSYPNFLYPGIGFPTHPNLVDVAPDLSDEQINHRVPDYENTSPMNRDINFDSEIDSYSFLSSSTSFEMPDYDAASYFKKDMNDRQPNILSAAKLSEINPFQLKNSLGYNEFGVESTTMDFRSTFDTLDYNIDAPITVGIYSTSVVEEASVISTKRNKDDKINFMDFSTQYESALDESALKDNTFFSSTTYLFTNNDENILSNQDIIRYNKEFIISTPSKDNDKQSTHIDAFNNKFIDEALFNNYTTKMDLFLTAEDHTISAANKKKQFNANPRTLLMALKPLSSDLQKLLSAVELVNQSISNVQSRLCDKRNIIRSTKIKKGSKKRKATKSLNKLHHYNSNLFTENFKNQVSINRRRIKTKDRIIANRATNVKLKKKTKPLFLDKLTIPTYKRRSSTKSLKIQNGRGNFLMKRKLNEKKFPKLGDVEWRRMSHLRFNRNLQSLTKNYGAQKIKSARQFTKSFEKIAHMTAPALTLTRLIRSNASSKNNFSNRFSSSTNKSFSNVFTKKNNQTYFLSNNKRNAAQHNAKRAMQKETHNSDMEEKFPSDDPPSQMEMTAYQEILGLLTTKPRGKYPIGVTQNVTESLFISTTAEFFATTTSLPYLIEEPSTTASTIAGQEEFPEATEYEYISASDFEYYGEDYDNYTGMYEDYEDEGNVTSWYDYMEKTTTSMKEIIAISIEDFVSEIIFEETTPSVTGIETSTETLIWHTTVAYPFAVSTLIEMTTVAIISEILETASVTESPVALSTFTLPLFYTTESTTLSIDETAILFSEITTEKAVTISAMIIPTEITEMPGIILITEEFTTESAMLLTALLEGMTDITLRITIPAATKISIKETTEKETMVITSTTLATELTRSLLIETSTSLYTFSTAPLFTTVETKSTIPVITPTVPVLTLPTIAERPQTTTSKGETTSVTERTITVTTIESTTALGDRTTLHEALTSKITFITRIETEMEDVTPFSTRAVTFATHIPTNATKMVTEKITSVAKENKTTGTIPEELETASTEVLTTINVTESSYTSVTKALITTTTEISTTVESTSVDTFAEMFVEPNRTITSTYVTTIASTPRVTESTIKTSTITSEIITTRPVTPTITSSPIISEKTETVLSTKAETASTPEEESPVTQIEKTITAEEMTTTETPTITEIPATVEMSTTIKTTKTTTTLMPARNLTIIEISTPIKTPTITKTSATTKISTTGESTIITKILTFIETPTITETPRVTAKTSEVPIITTITTILMTTNLTTKILTTEPPTKALTTIKSSVTTKIPTTMETMTITKTLMPTNVTIEWVTVEISTTETLTPTGTPTFTKSSATTEIPTTIETASITSTSIPTNLTTTEISTTETLTPTEIPTITELTTTEISTTIESTTITKILMPTNLTTIEILTTVTLTPTEIPTITKIATITESETYIESSTTITTIEILTPIETTTETPEISEISTTSEAPIITETTTTKTLTPTTATSTEILTIISTPTITETPIIIETSSIAETQTIIETPTITSTYITTPFSIESTTSSMITFPTKEFTLTSITPTIASTSAFSITPVTTISFETTIPVMSLELTITTPSSLIVNVTLSETPYTTISPTFFITTEELLIFTTISTTEMFLTTLSILENATVFSTNASTITTEIHESTTTTLTKIPIATPIMTETTYYETTPIVISTTFSTGITESTTPTSTISPLETYEASTEEETTTSTTTISTTTEFTKEERTSLITTEKVTTKVTTPTTYLSSLTTPFLVESTTETTAFKTITLSTPEKITFTATSEKISPIEEVTTVTFITTTEETLSVEEITNITFTMTVKETSTPIALISITERSTTSATETSTSLVPRLVTTIPSTLPKITTETVETSLITTIAASLSTTEKPEYMTTTEVAVTVTFTPFFEFTESALITSETPATTLEVISILPETEEFTTESPAYTTESSTILFTEITPLTISISSTEEYEECDKEIPTGEWFEYEEYETTEKGILSTVKYMKPEEGFTSPLFEKATTVSLYETKFTTYSTSAAIYTSSILSTPYTYVEEEFTSTPKTPIIVANTTASEAETESTASTVSEVEKSTAGPTFGSTEEYSLPSSTVFEITTKPLPLRYPTVSPEYTESTESTLESSTETTRELTLPKFVTQPEEIPEIERTTTSERILTETRVTVATSFFVSSVLTTLSEKEAVEVRVTTVSPVSWETAMETGYEITSRATTAMLITTEEYATPFVASGTEFEFTTTSETVGQRVQLLQQLDRLKEHEREMAEKEERLKERERQWNREKEERLQMMREKGGTENVTSTIVGYITTAVTNLTTLIAIVGAENLTASTTTEIEIPSVLVTISLPEIITISTPFYSAEEITPVTYTAEMTEQVITEESTTYVTTETEELAYTTERSTYTTEEPEETRVTDYIIFTPVHITTPITDLYGISVSSTTSYSIEETYITSYRTVHVSEPSFTSPTLLFTSTTTLISSTTSATISTETEYEKIERLKEELRKRERELEERERILLEREKKLERDILEFEKYMKETIDRLSIKESTVSTSLSTPEPPIEKTTVKVEVTTLVITEKKENRTTKMITSRYETTKVKGIEEKATTPLEEEEIATKRICLNVLANTTIPLGKIRRGIVIKKICLPYFPEKNEKEKSVGRLSRKPLTFQQMREFRRPKHLSDFRFRKKRQERAITRKISNLQLLHHEWLSNETVKPLQHFKSFTRIYQKTRKPFLRNVAIINAQEINNFYNQTSLYERRVLDHYENFFQPTTKSTLHSEKYEKRNAFFNINKINVKKRDISATKKNVRFLSTKNTANISSQKVTTATAEKKKLNNDEGGFYTVNVVQLGYDENEETHKVISAKPDNNDLTVITITPYELEEDEDLKEKDDELSEETEKKIEEENDDIDDMIENYMNYEERETSTLTHDTKSLNKSKNKRTTESKTELLDQIWPTERITSYHLGGTRFWELDFEVTEPPVSSIATNKSKTLDLSVTETTCLHVILKNERHSNSEIKRNIHYHKQNTYNNKMKKYNIGKKDTSLKNVTRKNALHNKLRTNWPGAVVKEWKHNLRNLRGSNHHKQNFERKRLMKPNESPLSVSVAGNENSIARSRKLCGVKEKKKNKTSKHQDAVNIKNKNKPKLAKSQKSQNVPRTSHSLENCTDSCIMNKKKSDKRHKTMITKTTINFHVKKSVAHPNVIVNHENKSISHERKLHDCINCICDIMNVINDIKSILDKTNFPLDEIKALNCSKYKETQDKIVISDMEEAKEFPQPHYNTEFLKGQKYIKLEELEDDFNSDLELDNDHDIISLPGLNLNLPCSQDSDGITWLSSISRPSYTWKRTDGIPLFGFVAENGDLELRNVNAKDTGNYTCVITYMGPDNEEPVETTYEIHLQVVTLPRYILYGENRYHIRSCDDRDMDVLVTYLPLKLNNVICEDDLCNAYVLPPSCTRNQITVNVLIVPSHIVKLMTVDPKHCNVLCLKAIQDKLSLILSRNLQIFLGKTNYLIMNRDWCRLLKRPHLQDGKEEGRVQIYSVENPAILACFPVVQLDMVFMVRAVFLVIWALIAKMAFHIAKSVRPVHISQIMVPEFVARALIQ